MSLDKKVVIVDDETDLCLLLSNYFSRKGYKVHVAHTSKEGLSLVREVVPDILFLDNNLHDEPGWSLAPGIAVDYPGMFIALVSAFHPHPPQMPENARFRVIEKPIMLSDLNAIFH